jgi:hypothetical protein
MGTGSPPNEYHASVIKFFVTEFAEVSKLPSSVRHRWRAWENLVSAVTRAERAQALREAKFCDPKFDLTSEVGLPQQIVCAVCQLVLLSYPWHATQGMEAQETGMRSSRRVGTNAFGLSTSSCQHSFTFSGTCIPM